MSHSSDLLSHVADCLRPPPSCTVSEWCISNLYIPPPQTQAPGWFRLDGREYAREPLDTFGDYTVTDAVGCFGSQTGKTTILAAGVAWSIVCDPCGVLWVLPNIDLARSFSETRWQPIVLHSPALARLVPTGSRRHAFTKSQQAMGGSLLNFIGSNSPSNLASRPAKRVILDEVDKFPPADKEADAVTLAEMRTKSFANPQRWKVSTPTIVDGICWQEFMKGDQRRYFIPCPRCSKDVLLIWSKRFTLFPIIGCEAEIVWDKEAKRQDGSWDLDRVERSARAQCPHCKGYIEDTEKTKAIRAGHWQPSAKAHIGFRSWHLSSLYACGTQTSFGALAVRFLQQKRSFLGLNGFINGDLAEPFESFNLQRERIELISNAITEQDTASSRRIMSVDCQASEPHFWWVVRSWEESLGTTVTNGIDAGHCETWEEVRDVQLAHKVDDLGVIIDSGFGARSDAEVYRQCARFSELHKRKQGRFMAMGWMPSKGMPTRKRWKDAKGLDLPYYLRAIDPYSGTSEAGNVEMSLFEFASEYFKDALDTMRDPQRRAETGVRWTVGKSMATEEYWRHMDSEIKDGLRNKRTGKMTWQWRQKSARWPNHLLDCEVMQVAAAVFFGLLALKEEDDADAK